WHEQPRLQRGKKSSHRMAVCERRLCAARRLRKRTGEHGSAGDCDLWDSRSARLAEGYKTVPIVVAAAGDLSGAGIVASLAHPGGNITGFSVIDIDISAKQLELLKAFSPSLSRVAVLLNPGNSANPLVLKHVESNAPVLGVQVVAVNASTSQGIETAFAEAAQQGAT